MFALNGSLTGSQAHSDIASKTEEGGGGLGIMYDVMKILLGRSVGVLPCEI